MNRTLISGMLERWGHRAILAKDGAAKIEAAVTIQDFEGIPPSYYSVIYARGDSGITSLKDYAGKEDKFKFAFVDAGSTSGFLAPSKMLIDSGANIDTVRKNQILAGGHDKALRVAVFLLQQARKR